MIVHTRVSSLRVFTACVPARYYNIKPAACTREKTQAFRPGIGVVATESETVTPTDWRDGRCHTLDHPGILTGPYNAQLLGLLAQDGYSTK